MRRFERLLPDAFFASLIALFLICWSIRAGGAFSLSAFAALLLVICVSLVSGALVLRATRFAHDASLSLPLRLVCGNLALGAALFVLALFSPLGSVWNFVLVSGLVFFLAMIGRRPQDSALVKWAATVPAFVCLALSGAGATLWSLDALEVAASDGPVTVFKLWPDAFFHVRQITEFALGRGGDTLSNIRMAGVRPPLYHYASYSIPAFVAAFSGSGAYELLVGYLIPFGVLLTGLAAFCFAGHFWGPWAGVAAALAIICLPDAFHQGFGNRYLGYNFLQQVNPGGFYGVAMYALAWTFVLQACRSGRTAHVVHGWVIAGVGLLYKAQLFVANAFLVMVYPFVFMARARLLYRLAVGALFVALFCAVVVKSQAFPGVPVLRLDGSGAARYITTLLGYYEPGWARSFFNAAFWTERFPWRGRPLFWAFMLVASTFGVWVIACLAMTFAGRRTMPLALLVFPWAVLGNYLLMSLGLALDDTASGMSDELLNRPLVWAYFALVTWTAGSAYAWAFGDALPRRFPAKAALGALLILALYLPFTFGHNLQTLPVFPTYASFRDHNAIATCVVAAAKYIRAHSDTRDIVQDSAGDARLALSGLAERRAFAVDYYLNMRPPPGLRERLDSLKGFNAMTDERDIVAFARSNRIAWYVLQPTTPVAWPAAVLSRAAFSCDGVRVYRFPVQ